MPLADAPPRLPADARMRVHRLARLMDSSIRLPGGFRIGVDGLIGLVRVVGDVAAVVLETDGSFSIVRETGRGPHSPLVDMSGADRPR